MARAPVAWVPLGALEYHADHLPNGTDGITGQGLLVAAAERLGGVVLPWSYVTMGTLALPWSFRYDPALVAEALRQTLRQLPGHGVAARGRPHRARAARPEPPDQARLRRGRGRGRRAAARTGPLLPRAERGPRDRARDRLAGRPSTTARRWRRRGWRRWRPTSSPRTGCPTTRPPRSSASTGRIPRFTADAATAAAPRSMPPPRCSPSVPPRLLRGEPLDPLADLRTFVERYWPEPLRLAGTGRATSATRRRSASDEPGAGLALRVRV